MKGKFSNNVVFDSREVKTGNDSEIDNEKNPAAVKKRTTKKTASRSSPGNIHRPDDESIEKKAARKKPGRKKMDPNEKKSQVAITIKQKTIDLFSETGDYRKKLNRYIDDNAEKIRKELEKY